MRALNRKTLSERPVLYMAPMIFVLVFVYFYPMVKVVVDSLRWPVDGKEVLSIKAFRLLVKDETFRMALMNNAKMLLCVPVLVILSLIVAILLYEVTKGSRFYRFLIFLPYILPIPVVGAVFSYLLQYNGSLNTFLRAVGLDMLAIDWLGNRTIAIFSIMGVFMWKQLGFGSLLFLSRLMTVSEELYDSAKIDGAAWLQRHWYVTVPQVWGIMEFLGVIQAINVLGWSFSYVYVMTQGGPGTSTFVMDYYIYKTAFEYRNMAMASAGATALLLITTIFIILQRRIVRQREIEYA